MDKNEQLIRQMGLAQRLYGMQYAIDQIQAGIDETRREIEEIEHARMNGGPAKVKRGRPSKEATELKLLAVAAPPAESPEDKVFNAYSGASKKYWNSLTDKQRKAEMARRARVREGLEEPRPKTQQGKRKAAEPAAVRAGSGGWWDRMTPEERKAEMVRRVAQRAPFTPEKLAEISRKQSEVSKRSWAKRKRAAARAAKASGLEAQA